MTNLKPTKIYDKEMVATSVSEAVYALFEDCGDKDWEVYSPAADPSTFVVKVPSGQYFKCTVRAYKPKTA